MSDLIHISGALFTDPKSGATIDANRLLADCRRLQIEAQQLRVQKMAQLQTREARQDENYTTTVNGPRCQILAYAPGDESHQELVCGGGVTPAAAIEVAQATIRTYGLEALRNQQRTKAGQQAVPGTEAAVFYTFGLKPVAEQL